VEILIKRDRNHPSIVIWSLCNEVLCESGNKTGDGLVAESVIRSLDPLGQRPISANNNGMNGADTILDLQGFDYATGNYEAWHNRAPHIPAISSETSSAVGDRGEYANDAHGGHVTGYDTQAPSWGQTAEVAWSAILQDDFMSGGFTWTGWDYKGEPTPYAWPDINSHFGILDIAGFWKDRTVRSGPRTRRRTAPSPIWAPDVTRGPCTGALARLCPCAAAHVPMVDPACVRARAVLVLCVLQAD
jgi:beta-galactosidase